MVDTVRSVAIRYGKYGAIRYGKYIAIQFDKHGAIRYGKFVAIRYGRHIAIQYGKHGATQYGKDVIRFGNYGAIRFVLLPNLNVSCRIIHVSKVSYKSIAKCFIAPISPYCITLRNVSDRT